jgi:hypothetical protein
MIRIKAFSDYYTPTDMKNALISSYGDTSNQGIVFTDGDDETHVILMNLATPELKVLKERVTGFIQEPVPYLYPLGQLLSYHDNYLIGRASSYFINQTIPERKDSHIFRLGHAHLFYQTKLQWSKPKEKLMSIIASNKTSFPGHQYRHHLINAILYSGLDIDVYGRGIESMYNHPRVKGTFDSFDETIGPYRFNIAIENCQLDYCITEKYHVPITYGTVPIYWGAKLLSRLYGPNAYIGLSGNLERDIHLLRNIINDPDTYARQIDFPKIRSSIDRHDLIHVIKNLWGKDL